MVTIIYQYFIVIIIINSAIVIILQSAWSVGLSAMTVKCERFIYSLLHNWVTTPTPIIGEHIRIHNWDNDYFV